MKQKIKFWIKNSIDSLNVSLEIVETFGELENIELEDISEIIQKDKFFMISLICGK